MFNRFHISMLVAMGAIAVLHAGAGSSPALAQTELAKLVAADGSFQDYYARAVSISGSVAVVGVHFDDDAGTSSGSAHVYRHDGSRWNHEAKLTASDAALGDEFGWSVAVDGDVIAVGAFKADDPLTEAGSVYIFRYNGTTWVEEDELTGAQVLDWFGYAVSVSGNVLAVGVPHDGSDDGAVDVYRHNGTNWVFEGRLIGSGIGSGDRFGKAVAVDGDVIVGGAWQYDNNTNIGIAYAFRFNGTSWAQDAELANPDPVIGDQYGESVAVGGDVIVVGVPYDDDLGDASGSAYVYRYGGGTWAQDAKLTASDGALGDLFGNSVAVDGAKIVVGASHGDDGSVDCGSAYVYAYDGANWSELVEINASDAGWRDWFGQAVSICGHMAIIGAYKDDITTADEGSAYVYALCTGDLNGDGYRNVTDFTLLAAAYNSQVGQANYNYAADMNRDGFVNITDFTQFAADYGVPCP